MVNTLHNTVINNVQIGIEVTSNQTLEMTILFAPCHYIIIYLTFKRVTFVCWTCAFLLLSMCLTSELWKKTAGTNIAMTDCTTEVTIMMPSSWKFQYVLPIKFLTKLLCQIFRILKTDRITLFCNWNDPRIFFTRPIPILPDNMVYIYL